MTEAEFFMLIYPVVPLIGLIGFLPQLITLIKITNAPKTISLSTWFIWTLTWLISFGYAVFVIQDTLFIITCGMNLVGHSLIISLTIYKIIKYNPIINPVFSTN